MKDEKTKTLVVARYKENIDWITSNNLHNFFNAITVYNKCYNEPIQLDNVGREAHTYFVYIATNYNNLSDYTIFCQGDPFDHCQNFIEQILNTSNYKNKIHPLCNRIITEGLQGNRGYQHPNGLPIKEWKNKLFPKNTDQNVSFSPGAQYIVPKEKILQHSQLFYQNQIKELIHSIDPLSGYIYERLWSIIFA